MKSHHEYVKKVKKEKVTRVNKTKLENKFKKSKLTEVCNQLGSDDILDNIKRKVKLKNKAVSNSNKEGCINELIYFNSKKKKKIIKSKQDAGLMNSLSQQAEEEIKIERKKDKKVNKKQKWVVNPSDEDGGSSCNSTKVVISTCDVNSKSEDIKESNWEEFVHESAKDRLKEIKTEPYKAGHLSDLLQIKKYGRLILPYDPSFGLDPTYKIPEWDDLPKVQVNPLFDLSKRKFYFDVFVGNLHRCTKPSQLKKIFAGCGPIQKIKLKCNSVKPKSGVVSELSQTRNAFVTFTTSEGYKSALEVNGTLYHGRRLRVTPANVDQTDNRDSSVFIGNLAYDAEDDDLWKAFESCGEIDTVRIVRNRNTGRGLGFGFVNFKSSDSAAEALMLDGITVRGRQLRVTLNKPYAASRSNADHVRRRHKPKRQWRKPNDTETIDGNSESPEHTVTEDQSAPKQSKKGKKKKPNQEEPVE